MGSQATLDPLDEGPKQIPISRRLEPRMPPCTTSQRCNSGASESTSNSRMSDLQGHTYGTEKSSSKEAPLDKVIVHVYDLLEFKRMNDVFCAMGRTPVGGSRCPRCINNRTWCPCVPEELHTINGSSHFLKLWEVDVVGDYNFSEAGAFEFTNSAM